jgi:hypothetical protein
LLMQTEPAVQETIYIISYAGGTTLAERHTKNTLWVVKPFLWISQHSRSTLGFPVPN